MDPQNWAVDLHVIPISSSLNNSLLGEQYAKFCNIVFLKQSFMNVYS